MQRAFTERNDGLDEDGTPINVRIGLHTGEPVAQGDDFYGVHVVMASRIADQANGGEVLVSALLRELVASSGEFELEAREPMALKGLDGEHVLHAVGWA
jgi:class 3 adenylate cyclase